MIPDSWFSEAERETHKDVWLRCDASLTNCGPLSYAAAK